MVRMPKAHLSGGEYNVPANLASCFLMQLDVVDWIGSGDGFSSGLIYGLLRGWQSAEACAWVGRMDRF